MLPLMLPLMLPSRVARTTIGIMRLVLPALSLLDLLQPEPDRHRARA